MAVRTKRLAKGVAAADVLAYTCPANHTTIVRYLNFSNESAGSITFTVKLGPTAPEVVLRRATLAAQGALSMDVWYVLQPGDEVWLRSGGGLAGMHYHISGSELLGVA